MLWVLKKNCLNETVGSLEHPKHMLKLNIYNFTLKNFAILL